MSLAGCAKTGSKEDTVRNLLPHFLHALEQLCWLRDPLGRFWQGKREGAGIVEETDKSVQGVARMEKKIKRY